MSSPTPPDLQAETRAAPTRKTRILGGIGLLLACAALTVCIIAVTGGKQDKRSATGDGGHPLGAAEQKVLVTWLSQHPEYRAAVDADCAFDEALRFNPGAHPYNATGDFNHDGKKDFAAAVINKKTGKFAVLIFNGPIGGIPGKPAFFRADMDLHGWGLFFGLSSEEPPRLYLGVYNSDFLTCFVPKGNTYVPESVLYGEPPDTTSATISNSAAEPLHPAAEPLPVEKRHVDRRLPGCGDQKDGCDHVEFTYVEVVGGPAVARGRINAAIVACLVNYDGSPEIDNRKFTPESFAQDSIDNAASIYKDHPSVQPSTLTGVVTVLRNAAPVFSLECDDFSSGGFISSLPRSKFLNLDPVTGGPIKLASILKDGAMARLTKIAEVHFRQERKLTATAKLEDGFGFPDGRFALNDNYGFGDKALLFSFDDEYEATFKRMGPTLVEIPYAEMRDLIRPGLPFYPSFDCRKATSLSEKTTCANVALSQLDFRLGETWKTFLFDFIDDSVLRTRMKRDQRAWIASLERCGDDANCIGKLYRDRLAVLNGADPAHRFSGVYEVKYGSFAVYPIGNRYLVSIQTMDTRPFDPDHPYRIPWTCDLTGEAESSGDDLEISVEGFVFFKARLRDAETLILREADSGAGQRFCGVNGYLADSYRRVRINP